jgi:GNAT superfamily N-acetyltransferase/nitroimidazol reductase NimA-like FMN-containing flavoprotein (pyridoxamine 5'-phosphate oxidase superfamily)
LGSGEPLIRTVHGVIVDGYLAFHGAPAGEKMEAIGRPAVAAAEEIIAEIPSYFVDPERACPATTYYSSVHVHGMLEAVEDVEFKTRVLAGLMRKFQPEGGHVPIDPGHPLYRNVVEQILIARISLEKIDGKAKLGQNRTARELTGVVDALWKRGRPGDARTIDLVLRANPKVPVPPFLQFPLGLTGSCALGPADVDETVELLAREYWNIDVPKSVIADAHLASTAWVGARDANGRLAASARAVSDLTKTAWIYDVIVAPEWRRRGVGKALMRLILDHPAVRNARTVRLATRDAQGLYRQFGFTDVPADSGNFLMVRHK